MTQRRLPGELRRRIGLRKNETPTPVTRISPQLEKDIERKIGEFAKQNGCLYLKFTSPARRAVPDRMIITPMGVIGFLELKAKGKKPTPLQMNEMEKLTKQCCTADWCDNVEDGREFVRKLLKKDREFC